MRALLCRAVLALLVFLPLAAEAGAIERLHRFLDDTKTLKAEFAQIVLAKGGRQQQSAGIVSIARPGKLRWEILKPYPQLVVGDGEKIWIYDSELRQVTVRPVGEAIGGSPAALLAGRGDLERNFTLREAGESEGLVWVEATPKAGDSGFEQVRIGFAGNDLKAMELRDSFGQTTLIRFSALERNPALPPATFRFTPPADADVIGE
ncbi:MAG: outer membrane lipoprotein chaperone LolA [Betaproteobacteria bacterium]|nr:outer membrane lipoprotein chaperone LolA [Betaproteobacteria bacterium]MCL2886149.1 outer membrane lipoprotein chaperone LolA [Betaproteobacteria bacterium]